MQIRLAYDKSGLTGNFPDNMDIVFPDSYRPIPYSMVFPCTQNTNFDEITLL